MAGAMMMSSSSGAKCHKIRGSQIRDLLESKHNVLFDCDGVIWNGDSAVPGAPEAVGLLKRRGKRVFFVTNNCTRPRENYVQKFRRLGFADVAEEEIFSSAYCSAAYLRDVAKLRGKVFVIGCHGVRKELRDAGLSIVEDGDGDGDGEGSRDEERNEAESVYNCPLDPDVEAVLVGFDEKFNFLKLAKACCYLRDSEQCLFLATDPDPWHPLRGGRVTPGSGSLTAALETASSRKATVIGKPSRFMYECIASQFQLDPAQTLMVGDRLETDILFGANCGLETMLTLTGVSTLEEAQAYKDADSPEKKDLVPDYVVESVADFLEALEEPLEEA